MYVHSTINGCSYEMLIVLHKLQNEFCKMVAIFLIGSSHAKRLGYKMANLLGSVHTVVNLGKSGAKFNQIVWPQVSDVKPGDVFIVLPFGNELQKQRSRVVNRVWTIQNYDPISETEYSNLLDRLRAKLMEYPDSLCDKYIVTNFYRCLGLPTQQVQHPGWLRLQIQFNRILKSKEASQFFGARTFIIPHQDIVTDRAPSREVSKNWVFYSQLQYDGIHFKDYRIIANRILDIVRLFSTV